jgi:hypothetical protein
MQNPHRMAYQLSGPISAFGAFGPQADLQTLGLIYAMQYGF